MGRYLDTSGVLADRSGELIGQGIESGVANFINALERKRQRKREEEQEAGDREAQEFARALQMGQAHEQGIRFGEMPEENTEVRLPDVSDLGPGRLDFGETAGSLAPSTSRVLAGDVQPSSELRLGPLGGQFDRTPRAPLGNRSVSEQTRHPVSLALPSAPDAPASPMRTAKLAPRFLPLLTGKAYVDRNATRSAREASREERLSAERPTQPRNIDPLSPEGRQARILLDEERKRRGLMPSGGADADDAARIAEGEEDEIETYIKQRMDSYQKPELDAFARPVPGTGLDTETAHEKAIDDALALYNRVPRRWLEQAASDPEYAAHLKEHGIDPVTGRSAKFRVRGGVVK